MAGTSRSRMAWTGRFVLAHLPIGLFGMVMGLAGTALATQRVAHGSGAMKGVATVLAPGVAGLALLIFAGMLLLYGAKCVRSSAAVVEEWHHPVRLNFFPAVTISVALIATLLVPVVPSVANVLWIVAAGGHAIAFIHVVSSWMGPRTIPVAALNPAWFIPAVGNVVMPLAGVPLGYPALSWLFFGVGIVFWLLLLPMIVHRFVFEEPLPPKLTPTVAILIAPPAVGFIAYLRLAGALDGPAQMLFGATLAFAALVVAASGRIAKSPFGVPWWALSFPSAALTIAVLNYGDRIGSSMIVAAGEVLWGLLLALIAMLLVRTVRAHARGEIFVKEG